MAKWPGIIAVVASLLLAGRARAEVTGIFTPSGNASPALKRDIVDAASRALKAIGRRIVATGAPIEDSTVVLGCSINEASCLESVAKSLEVDELLFGALENTAHGVRLRLTFSDAHAKVLGIVDETIDPDILPTKSEELLKKMLPHPSAPAESVAKDESKPKPKPKTVVVHEPPKQAAPAEATHATTAPATKESSGFDLGRVGVPAMVITGVGVVLVAAGSVLAFNAKSSQEDFDAKSAALPAMPTANDLDELQELDRIASSGKNKATVSQTTLLVGGILTLAGVVLGILNATGSNDASPTIDAPPHPGVASRIDRIEVRW